MTKLRKALVVGVMSMTVLSMSVVVAPEAGAAAQAGDLIKMDGLSSVYYLAADGKRYVFPNEKTYFSWYSDFSGVVTIPQAELETYPLGANVTVRPGTKLIKITTDPKVYAVETDGMLKHVPDEATAQTLWGADWANRVVDIADAFFTNYTVTGEEVMADAYPTGSLVQFGEDATVYYIDASGMARAIADEAAFLANRFKWDDIVKATIDMPTAGTDVTGMESDLTDTSSGAGGQALAGTGLTVSLSGDTAASANIPSCSTLVPWATYNFTAANDGAVTINSLVLTRRGAGSYDSFSGGYLFAGDERLTTKRSVNSSENTITFTALNLSIPAGMTKAVTLKMNAEGTGNVSTDCVAGDANSDNHYFEIATASDVDTNGAVVSGSFPVAGNTLAYASVFASDVSIAGNTGGGTYKIGETDVVLADFTVSNGTEEVVDVYRLRLKQDGTANDDAISNLSLYFNGDKVAEGVSMENRYVDFMLDTPVSIDKSDNLDVVVYGDIVDGIDKTIDLYANNVADFDVRGSAYGNNYSANILIGDFEAGDVSDYTIAGSEINVSFDGPTAQDIKDDTKDVVLANFKIKSNNLDVNIETMSFELTSSAADATEAMENFEMVDSGNGVSYSITSTFTGGTDTATFENVYLEKGVQYNFELRGDVPEAADENETYSIAITFSGNFTARYQDDNETTVTVGTDLSSASLTGKTMTVKDTTVILSKVTTTNSTVVENAKGVLLYKGKITASNVDDLVVKKVKFTGDLTNNLDDAFDKLYFHKVNSDGTETELDTETSLDLDDPVFQNFNLNIPKGASNGIYVVVRGDVKDSPTADTIKFKWSGTDGDYTIRDSENDAVATLTQDSTNYGQETTIAAKGEFTMAIDKTLSGLNNDKNVLAGSESLLGRIKLTAAKEEATLEDFALRNMGTAAEDDIAYVRIYADQEMTELLGEANLSGGYALYEDVNINIPTTGITYLYIAGVVKSIDYSNSPSADATADASETITWAIGSSTGYAVKALGVSTGEELSTSDVASSTTSTYTTKTSTIMGAIASDISSSFANASLVAGANKRIFSFTVTAPDSSNVDYDGSELDLVLATTTFQVATNTDVNVSDIKIQRVGGSAGKLDAKTTSGANTAHDGDSFVIDYLKTFVSNMEDLEIAPGDTATFEIYATIDLADSTGNSLQVYIDDAFDSDVQYVHNTNGGTAGSDGANTAAVYPLISGVTDVTAGSLSD
jgi:hypothetical protein